MRLGRQTKRDGARDELESAERRVPMSEPFFAMRNVHSDNCGKPPIFRNDVGGKYYGYFENFFGEQWVFVYDRETKTAEIRGGDASWQNVFPVADGCAEGVILGRDELQWLQACWTAATGKR
jgi:hypothetical protein